MGNLCRTHVSFNQQVLQESSGVATQLLSSHLWPSGSGKILKSGWYVMG